MPLRSLILGFAAALALPVASMPGPVVAQAAPADGETAWRIYDNARADQRGAVICPMTEPTGGFVCVAVDCDATSPLSFRLTASVPVFPAQVAERRRGADRQDGAFVVDGRRFEGLRFVEIRRRGRGAPATDYAASVHPFDDAPLVDALKTGRRGTLVIGSAAQARRLDFALDGARDAIARAQALCPVGRYAVMDPDRPDRSPNAHPRPGDRIAALRRGCRALGGDVEIGSGFARVVNVEGDGAEDLILDYGALSCGDGARPFCTEAGCLTELWLWERAGLSRVVAEVLAELALPGEGLIELRRPADACGAAGVPCVTRLRAERGLIWRLD